MPPNVMKSNIGASSESNGNGGSNADTTRRRRANSKDMRCLSPVHVDDRHHNTNNNNNALYVLNQPRSPAARTGVVATRRKRRTNFLFSTNRMLRLCGVLTLDIVIVGYVVHTVMNYMHSSSRKVAPSSSGSTEGSAPTKLRGLLSKTNMSLFQKYLPDLPSCDPLEPDEVSFTLSLQLSGNRLWMMKHHCELWGSTAPISVAVWTTLGNDEIMSKLKRMGCDPNYIHLQTVSSESHSGVDYPINRLRNLALTGVTTSHVLLLDVDFWESVDLFDTLNSPKVRNALSRDPQFAAVIPAFQIHDLNCGNTLECRDRHIFWMPKDFEDLVISLGNNKSLPYDPMNFSRQGSTNYRLWMRQTQAEVLDIPCVSSDQYQPYIVVRLCEGLPPFQERFMGHSRNNMAWMLHLRRLGYRLGQIGGSFVTHFPHEDSLAKLEWNKVPTHTKSSTYLEQYVRDRIDKIYLEFKQWLDINVDDATRIEKCEDYSDDQDLVEQEDEDP